MRLAILVVGMIAGAFADDADIEMILQIAADARQIVDRPEPYFFNMCGRPDSRLE